MKIEEKIMENKVNFWEETNFKNTEIGEIPAGWEVVKLGDVLQEIKTKNKEVKSLKVYSVSNIHGFIESDEFFDKKVYSADLKPYKLVMENDFAYNPYRVNVGSIGLFKERDAGLVSPAYVVFKIKNEQELLPEFLYSNLKSPKYISEISRIAMSRGSVRRSLSFKDLGLISIPLPPLEEQKAIAYMLSTVQEAREKTEKVIEATKELKKSLMKHLFTYGPVSFEEASRISLKETEIGEIPADWEVVKLKDMASVVRGISWKNEEENRNGFGVPVLSIPNIEWGQVSFDFKHFLKGPIPPSKIIQKHDIIFVTSSGSLKNIGRNCLVTDLPSNIPIAFASFLAVLRLKRNVNLQPDFLYYLINSHYVDFSKYTKRASDGKNNFQVKEFEEKVLIPLPPLPVQKRIAEILQTVDEKIQAEEKKKQALDNLFNSMLHMLMSGKLRVKFQTSEEGASG